jgi:GNAT superfamily N-acetyltransferase
LSLSSRTPSKSAFSSVETLLRPVNLYDPTELGLVLNSWVRTALANKNFAGLERSALATAVRETIMSLLDRGAQIDVAVWAEDPSVIAGYVCYEATRDYPLIHFVYVKDKFREGGLGSDLVAHGRAQKPGLIHYTFKNRNTKRVIRTGSYRPFLVRTDDDKGTTDIKTAAHPSRSAGD